MFSRGNDWLGAHVPWEGQGRAAPAGLLVEIGGFRATNLRKRDGEMSEAALVEMRDEEREGIRVVRLRIPAKAEYIALARLALTGLTDLAGVTPEVAADLKLALTEAVSNSVRHAYGDTGGFVEVAYELSGQALAIEVVDDGAGFDPERPPALEGEELSEGGLGIAIIRTIADDFEIESEAGVRGSRLRFAKRLRSQ